MYYLCGSNPQKCSKLICKVHVTHSQMYNEQANDDRLGFLCSLAISRALRQHPARPHPDQGQLCGAGSHSGHQGHLSQVPQQVGSVISALV